MTGLFSWSYSRAIQPTDKVPHAQCLPLHLFAHAWSSISRRMRCAISDGLVREDGLVSIRYNLKFK
jgi:hypothetical protein